jgi:ferredoxin-thioredoxin reductase catalytic subunit
VRLQGSWSKPVHLPLQPLQLTAQPSAHAAVASASNAQPRASTVEATASVADETRGRASRTGQSFNACPSTRGAGEVEVRVHIPTDVTLLRRIHRCIEFVVREGPEFEAMLIDRERDNSHFAFLTDYCSDEHAYYRWKLFSILQGDSQYLWRTEPFRMYDKGPLWVPPAVFEDTNSVGARASAQTGARRGQLVVADRDRLEDMLRTLTTEREDVARAMVFCIERAAAGEEVRLWAGAEPCAPHEHALVHYRVITPTPTHLICRRL